MLEMRAGNICFSTSQARAVTIESARNSDLLEAGELTVIVRRSMRVGQGRQNRLFYRSTSMNVVAASKCAAKHLSSQDLEQYHVVAFATVKLVLYTGFPRDVLTSLILPSSSILFWRSSNRPGAIKPSDDMVNFLL